MIKISKNFERYELKSKKIKNKIRYSIEDLSELAEKRGGRCLSKVYSNTKSNIIWKCASGHIFVETWENVLKGLWCPYDSFNRKKMLRSERLLQKMRDKVYK